MPILHTYDPNPRLLGRVAQFAGEGAYRTRQLNPLATADVNRSVATQLSLLDVMEGARRANLGAQVSRSNTLDQLRQQQAQARFTRQSQERMAIYQNAQQMQRLQALGRFQQQQAQAWFGYQVDLQQIIGNQRLGQAEHEFGFAEQLQA